MRIGNASCDLSTGADLRNLFRRGDPLTLAFKTALADLQDNILDRRAAIRTTPFSSVRVSKSVRRNPLVACVAIAGDRFA